MAIITKPVSENKAKKLKESLVQEDTEGTVKVDVESGVEPRFVILGARAQRVSTATTVCIFLIALIVLSIGTFGGMYLYRQFARSQMHYHGWCRVHSNQARHEYLVSDSDFEVMNLKTSFKQGFEIDLETETYEKIEVPDFGRGRKGRFIHDFSVNKTGIVDVNGHRCFVMPLNRETIVPPRSLYELLQKLSTGYYDVDTETVREMMRVVLPPLTDLKGVGQHIARECKSVKTYLLEKDDRRGIKKRSVPTSQAIFAEYAGKKMSELYIDTTALDEYEKKEAAAAVQV